MPSALPPSPPGWGKDLLTNYADTLRKNQFATFDRKRPQCTDLIRIDALFDKFLNGAVNPRPFFPMNFLLRAHAAYRAAAGAVMGGQVYEAQALLRLTLEHGGYGFYINSDVERWERWLARKDSADAKKLFKKEFTHRKVVDQIAATSRPISIQYDTLYEQLIDFGAHPNEPRYFSSATLERTDDRINFMTIYLHPGDTQLDFGLRTAAQVGLCVLHIAQLIYKDRFMILGIRDDLEDLRKRY